MALSRQKGIERIIKEVQKSKAKKIQSTHADFPNPEKFGFPGKAFNSKSFTPDVIAEYKDHTDFYSFETGTSKSSIGEALQKWILLSTIAKKKSGTFYVVADVAKVDIFRKILDQKKVSAELLGFEA